MHIAARAPDSVRGRASFRWRKRCQRSRLTVRSSGSLTPLSRAPHCCHPQDLVELLLKNQDGSWNMDGAFTTRIQNTKGKFPEVPVGDMGIGASYEPRRADLPHRRETFYGDSACALSDAISKPLHADAETIREMFKEVLPIANTARKERAQRVWDEKHGEYQKSCSATMVGVL